ncbi:MAG: hypothetical protein MZW92_19240 [Comamonadaceae bacterium]|nr:hypothetical protein [Comamonadaceae bacterium]
MNRGRARPLATSTWRAAPPRQRPTNTTPPTSAPAFGLEAVLQAEAEAAALAAERGRGGRAAIEPQPRPAPDAAACARPARADGPASIESAGCPDCRFANRCCGSAKTRSSRR